MQFDNGLFQGILIKRYKRFLADVQLVNGQCITAYCPNPGAMLGLTEPGLKIWLNKINAAGNAPLRKYPFVWELIQIGEHHIGINTNRPNDLVAEALELHKIPELAAYHSIQREVKYGINSRIDFLLQEDGLPPCYLEIKNVHLKRGSWAEFPDCVTARGTKHLQELTRMAEQGARAVILYVVRRADCHGFKIASDIDPHYDKFHKIALSRGVQQLCYQCDVRLDGIILDKKVTIDLVDK